jgi:DNA-binding transcriptional LysR family regulator
MPIRAFVVASTAYFAAHGRPVHPAELADHRCILYANNETWRFTGPGGEQVSIRPEGPLRSSSGEAMQPALRAGNGVTVLPDFIVGPDLTEGTLEAVLTDWSPPPIALHLVTPPNPLRPARVEALIRFLVKCFSSSPP